MTSLPVEDLPERVVRVDTDSSVTTWHIPAWSSMADPRRLAFIRKVAQMRARDHRISELVVSILRGAGAKPRDFKSQAGALLRWVQTEIYYKSEIAEILQDPLYTANKRYGDCDDSVLILASFFENLRAAWRLCLAGVQGGKKVKGSDGKTRRVGGKKIIYIEGSKYPQDCEWSHIFLAVSEPFTAKTWYFCETTLPVPLGWHVLSTDPKDKKWLPPPEAGGAAKGPPRLMPAPPTPPGFRPSKLPPKDRRSPAYDFFYLDPGADDLSGAPMLPITDCFPGTPSNVVRFNPSDLSFPAQDADLGDFSGSALSPIGVGIGIGTAAEVDAEMAKDGTSTTAKKLLDFEKMLPGIVTGVAIAVSTQLLLDWIRPKLRIKKPVVAETA